MRALITGASGGIGLEFAHRFAADHYDLVLTARSADRLENLASELREKYRVAVDVLPEDLAQSAAAKRLFDAVLARNLEIAFLINNAGFGRYGPFVEHEIASEIEQIQVNVVALTELTRLFLVPMMERGNGRILNVASIAAFTPGPNYAVYNASKAFVLSFTEAIAHEIRGSGVTATCLCPGPTESNFGVRSGYVMNRNLVKKIPSAAEVATFGYAAMFRGEAVAVHGVANRAMTVGTRFAPRSFVTKIAGQVIAGSTQRTETP